MDTHTLKIIIIKKKKNSPKKLIKSTLVIGDKLADQTTGFIQTILSKKEILSATHLKQVFEPILKWFQEM